MLLGLVALVPAFAAPTHAQIESASWAQISTRDTDAAGTVTVYQATVAGMTCFKGTAVTPAPVDKLLEVACDIGSAKRWSTAGVTRSELLQKTASTLQYWEYLDTPGWTLASDRFWFVKASVGTTGETSFLRWDELADGGDFAAKFQEVRAEYPDAVEPVVNVGAWFFTKTDAGSRVDYEICTDPGGSIPVAIQTAAERRTLPDSLGDLVREARKRAGI
jgi:hypothetical protein